MLSFVQYIFESQGQGPRNFIFAVDGNHDLLTSTEALHIDAFPHLFSRSDEQERMSISIPGGSRDIPLAWGRVDDGLVSIVTDSGHEPHAATLLRTGKRINRAAENDLNYRIHTVRELSKINPNLKFRNLRNNWDYHSTHHTASEHLKYLTDLFSQ